MARAKRRHNGEGQIWTHSQTKRLAGRVSVTDALGHYHRETIYQRVGESRAEFMTRFDEHKRAAKLNRGQGVHALTVGELVLHWLEKADHKASSRRVVESVIKNHILPTDIASRKASDLKPLQVQAYYDALVESGRSMDTVFRVHVTLGSAYKHGNRMQLVANQVMTSVASPKVKWEHARALTRDEQQRFFAAAREVVPKYYHYLYCVAAFRGRPAEIAALTVADIHINGPVAYVRNAGTKTAQADRITPITKTTVTVLKEYLLAAGLSGLSEAKAKTTPLFTSPRGGKKWHNQINTYMPKIVAHAGITGAVTLHDLRATGITRYMEAGVSRELRWASQGHSGAQSEKSYLTADPLAWAPELDKVADLI